MTVLLLILEKIKLNPGVEVKMKCFKYKIYNDSKLVLINWINRESEDEALTDLKNAHPGSIITLMEVWLNWGVEVNEKQIRVQQAKTI